MSRGRRLGCWGNSMKLKSQVISFALLFISVFLTLTINKYDSKRGEEKSVLTDHVIEIISAVSDVPEPPQKITMQAPSFFSYTELNLMNGVLLFAILCALIAGLIVLPRTIKFKDSTSLLLVIASVVTIYSLWSMSFGASIGMQAQGWNY